MKNIDKQFLSERRVWYIESSTCCKKGEADRTNIVHLICLHVIIADAMDSLKQTFFETEQFTCQDQQSTCADEISWTNKNVEEREAISSTGERMSQG